MIGVPPICQSPDGNGGESNGAGGIRRGSGEESGAGVSYAGLSRSWTKAVRSRPANDSAEADNAEILVSTAKTTSP